MARRVGTGFLVVVVVSLTLLASTGGRHSTAQEATAEPVATIEATATPTAYPFRSLKFELLARADISLTTDGPVTVSAASVVITADAETVPFTAEGPTVITVQTGSVTITSDNASIGVADIASVIGLKVAPASPVAADAIEVSPGMQVYLPAGATASFRNDGDKPATVVILSVVPNVASTAP